MRRLWNDTNRDFDFSSPDFSYEIFKAITSQIPQQSVLDTVSTSGLSWNGLSGDTAASGGYLLYPNKPNTNMMQTVYGK